MCTLNPSRLLALSAGPSSSSSSSPPSTTAHARRRSVDVGGLALALHEIETGTGRGWGGWDSAHDHDIQYAELLCEMYTQTASTLDIPVMQPVDTVSPETRRDLISQLSSWSFEPYNLPDEEAFVCTELLFELLLRVEGIQSQYNIRMGDITPFLRQLRAIYQSQNQYHNFKHAIDVLQAIALFLSEAGIVPPISILLESGRSWKRLSRSSSSSGKKSKSKGKKKDPGLLQNLNSSDVLALFFAAIGHDVGHPGLSNAFMKNAKTTLSIVYDDRSALEQMHCALLMHIMRRQGLAHLLTPPFKGMLHGIILSTDMSLHPKWMQTFEQFICLPHSETHLPRVRLLCCQALIKCADISNPARPHPIARNWAAALHSEWASQAQLEERLSIQISVSSPGDAKQEATSQIGFILACTLPLFQLCTRVIPALRPFTAQCESNVKTWRSRLASLQTTSSSIQTSTATSPEMEPLPKPQPNLSFIFPFSVPASLLNPPDSDAISERSSNASASPDRFLNSNSHSPIAGPSSNRPGNSRPPSRMSISPSETSMATLDTTTSRATEGSRSGDNDAIRAAYQAGIRKKQSIIGHRGSWAPSTSYPIIE